jgi:hypothetical protein
VVPGSVIVAVVVLAGGGGSMIVRVQDVGVMMQEHAELILVGESLQAFR